MSSTLVMRLCAPTQSWGRPGNRHQHRPTGSFPTHSALTGLICNALGAGRGDPIEQTIAAMDLTIRIDRPGRPGTEFQTIGGTINTMGKPRAGGQVTSQRGYLADACFTAFCTWGTDQTARDAETAMRAPARPVYYGRRAYPATTSLDPRLHAGEADTDLVASWPMCPTHPPTGETWDIVTAADTWDPETTILDDSTAAAGLATRDHQPRAVHRTTIPRTKPTTTTAPGDVLFTIDASGRLVLPGERP